MCSPLENGSASYQEINENVEVERKKSKLECSQPGSCNLALAEKLLLI